MSSDQRTHVLRPVPPWRGDATPLTQCGLTPAADTPVWDIREFAGLLKRDGVQRMAILTCMSCWHRAHEHPVDWTLDPVDVIVREGQWARARVGHGICPDRPAAIRFRDELLALAELVARHGDEFEGILAGLADTTLLADRRRTRRRSR
jgi:hypothetical protein